MFKKGFSIIIMLCLLLSFTCISLAESADYSYLDNMTLDELTALKAEIEKRINAQTKSSVPSSDYGMWEIKNYVDEFKNPTDQQYIRNKTLILGTFSNSAVNNRELKARFLIDESGVAILLYEYGDSLVKNSYSQSRSYKVTMQNGDGEKIILSGTMSSAGDRIWFSRADSDRIIFALRHDYKVSFYIVDQERKTNTYLLTIDDSSYFSNIAVAYFGEDSLPALDAKQEIYPAIYDQEKASTCATLIPEGMFSWSISETKEHKGDPFCFTGTVIASKNNDKFYIDIGNDQIVYVDFSDAYNKKLQSSVIIPSVGDRISVYCSFDTTMYDFDLKQTVGKFILGIDNKKK